VTASSWDKHRRRSGGHDISGVGMNAKPTEATAALGVAEAGRLPSILGARARTWLRLRAALGDVGAAVRLPAVPHDAVVVPYLFPLVVDPPAARDEAFEQLRAARIEAGKHYIPLHRFAALADRLVVRSPLAITDYVGDRALTLPCHQGLSDADLARMIDAVTACVAAPIRSRAPVLAS
jgi:dTDP-4-amino-4,6-dideoxygalactose transaminase